MSSFRYRLLAVIAPLALIASSTLALAAPWHLDVIDQCNPPFDNVYSPHHGTGSGYTVYIIGTGIRPTHVDFGGRAQQLISFASGGNEDCHGHGTWLASLVGGNEYGVAKDVQIRGVKVIDECGHATPEGIISGIEYVQNNADGFSVAVFSFAFESTPEIDQAINNLVASGVPTAVPAGDVATDACGLSPAGASNALTVGAHDGGLDRPSDQGYGSCIDIYAPGGQVTGAWHTSDTATNTLDGTAASAAIVAGALALYGKDSWALMFWACQMPGGWLRVYV